MDPKQLFFQDGIPAQPKIGNSDGIWVCSNCGIIHIHKKMALECCGTRKCACGNDCERGYWTCRSCISKKDAQKENERFDKAEKVTEWDSWVYSEGYGYQNGYFECVEEFIEWFKDNADEGDELPEYVWTCTPNQFVKIDADDIIQNIYENSCIEDNDDLDLNGEDELREAIEKFEEINKDNVTYEINYKKALLLNKDEFKNLHHN